LAERLAVVDLAVFVDATVGVSPGNVAVARLGAGGQGGLVHHVEPAQLLALAGQLYGRAPPAFLVTVCVAATELGEGLSQVVAAAVPEAIAAIRALLLEYAA
jgi:hydrogenase maturation protease